MADPHFNTRVPGCCCENVIHSVPGLTDCLVRAQGTAAAGNNTTYTIARTDVKISVSVLALMAFIKDDTCWL